MEKENIKEILSKKIVELNYDVVTMNTSVIKGNKTLSIVVDRVEPIDMNSIVDLTHKINEVLDEINPYDDPYTLDVSSLGAEKPLQIDKLDAYIDRYIHVHLINPIKGENIYEGILEGLDENTIKLSYKIKTRTYTVDITKENISKIRLAIKL
jgi:ribosome maturation factor RimP